MSKLNYLKNQVNFDFSKIVLSRQQKYQLFRTAKIK